MTARTPTLTEAMTSLGEYVQGRTRTITPARVVSFTEGSSTSGAFATVQPEIKVSFPGGGYRDMDPIPDCPVIFPGGGGWSISWPLIPGDHVALLIADRDLGRWRQQGREVAPGDGRRHNPGDAIVLPGLNPDTIAPTTPTGDLMLKNDAGTVSITIKPDKVVVDGASVEIGAAATEAVTKAETLISVLDTAIGAAVTAAGSIGPPNGDGGTSGFTALKTSWDGAKATIKAAKAKAI
ncbi:MAG: hypothetical protein GY926_19350 [bacterium]|nr:hypothetical protein [bacterium]